MGLVALFCDVIRLARPTKRLVVGGSGADVLNKGREGKSVHFIKSSNTEGEILFSNLHGRQTTCHLHGLTHVESPLVT